MTRKAETADTAEVDPAAGLTTALAELESAAIERARALIAGEAKSLQERIRKLEELVTRLQQRPQPTPVAAPKPSAPESRPQAAPRPNGSKTPVRTQAKASRARELPPLPAHRTLATLRTYLKSLGFDLASFRSSGGGAWVFKTQEEFGHVAEHLKKNGVGVLRYPRGRRRYPGDHFEIDPSKVLPEQ